MGDRWWETGHTRKVQAHEGHTTKCLNFTSPGNEQWAAHDTLPQALQHDLMTTALLKQTRIHSLTNRKICKLIKTHYVRFRVWAQMNLTLVILTHFFSCPASVCLQVTGHPPLGE